MHISGQKAYRGKRRRADFLLTYKNIPLAIVEAKDNKHATGAGMQQGLGYVTPPGRHRQERSHHETHQEIADLFDQAEVSGLDEEITAALIAGRHVYSYPICLFKIDRVENINPCNDLSFKAGEINYYRSLVESAVAGSDIRQTEYRAELLIADVIYHPIDAHVNVGGKQTLYSKMLVIETVTQINEP
jgi:hypothetical protein